MNRGQLIGFWLGVGEGMGSTGTHVSAARGQMGALLSGEQSCRAHALFAPARQTFFPAMPRGLQAASTWGASV